MKLHFPHNMRARDRLTLQPRFLPIAIIGIAGLTLFLVVLAGYVIHISGWLGALFTGVAGLLLLAMAGSLQLCYLLLQRIGHELKLLTKALSKFGAGNLAVRVKKLRQPELERAGESFNSMAGALQQQVTGLQAELSELKTHSGRVEQECEELRAMLDATDTAMLLVSPAGHALASNRRFSDFFEVPTEEIAGHAFQDLYAMVEGLFADPASIQKHLALSVSDRQHTFFETIEQTAPHKRELALSSIPTFGAEHEYIGRYYAWRDVTDERELARLKSAFVAQAAHALHMPLQLVRDYAELLEEQMLGELTALQQECINNVEKNATHLAGLMTNLLDLLLIESGTLELHRIVFDPNTLVQELAQRFQSQVDARGRVLALHLLPSSLEVRADAERLTQVLTILLSNALRYTHAGGRISIELQREGDALRVGVQDTGIGLSPEEQAHIFTPFYQARHRLLDQEGGGLSLVVARALVEMHGGTMQVVSVQGEGSAFSFTLPIVQTTSYAAHMGQQEEPPTDAVAIVKGMFGAREGCRPAAPIHEIGLERRRL
ncbi:MAG: ATP-binding protein [Chloroflexota bacterium]|nr:ATP-binding protein [Chloroflexota bacterium]